MLIMNKVQNNILGGKLNFFSGKQNLGSLCPNGQVPLKVNVDPCLIIKTLTKLLTFSDTGRHVVPGCADSVGY